MLTHNNFNFQTESSRKRGLYLSYSSLDTQFLGHVLISAPYYQMNAFLCVLSDSFSCYFFYLKHSAPFYPLGKYQSFFKCCLNVSLSPRSFPNTLSSPAPIMENYFPGLFTACSLVYYLYPSLKFKTYLNYNSTRYINYLIMYLSLCCHKSRSSIKQQPFLILKISSTQQLLTHTRQSL